MIRIGRCSFDRNGAKLDVTLSKAPDLEPPSPRIGGKNCDELGWFVDVWGQHIQLTRKENIEKIRLIGFLSLKLFVYRNFQEDSPSFFKCSAFHRFMLVL